VLDNLLIYKEMRLALELLCPGVVEILLRCPSSVFAEHAWQRTSTPERYYMKQLSTFVSDNGPFLLICGMVAGIAASLLASTAAYLHA
jgi:hypothetical protein